MVLKRALLITYGTRGDVVPFLAVAQGLRDAAFAVTLAAPARFREDSDAHGITFVGLSDAVLSLIDTDDGRAVMQGDAGVLVQVAASLRLAHRAAPLNANLMRDVWDLALAVLPSVIVFHPKVVAAPHIAERLAIPAVMGCLQPMAMPTRAFPACTVDLPIPGYNRASYSLARFASRGLIGPVNRFREQTLRVPPIRHVGEVLFPPNAGKIPVLHAISPQVLPRPADWPNHAFMTGYWRCAGRTDFQPREDLAGFLEAGSAPVFVGFGSMPSGNPNALAETIIGALRRAGQRGVIASGEAGLVIDANADILCVPALPHAWAFPRMRAVIHHGGAGTTAEGLFAGVPSVLCPSFGDQGFWARRLVMMGVSPSPVSRRRLSVETLADAIQNAVGDPRFRNRAQALAAKLAEEDGVRTAVAIVVRTLKGSRE